jgi:ferrous iron transport protein B
MSCSARLPVYTVLIAAFFNDQAGNVLFSIYLLGIMMAIVMAFIFRSLLLKGSTEPFVMELPPYGIPLAKSVVIHMWERSVLYAQKAGTIILAASILMWFLTHYPTDITYSQDYDQLAQQAEEQFSAQVDEDIYKKLEITQGAENPELNRLISELTAIQKGTAAKEKEENKGTPEIAALEAQKELQLQQVEEADPVLFPLAKHYVELKDQLADTQEKLDNTKAGEKLGKSYAGKIGHLFEPITAPLGFDWKMNVALVAGFSAKEVVVSTLGTIYSLGADAEGDSPSLKAALAADPALNPLIAYTLMVFILLYSPCLAAIATIKRETDSWKWAGFTMVYLTVLAWVGAFIVYHGGLLLGFGG